jgi:hypothetical protein
MVVQLWGFTTLDRRTAGRKGKGRLAGYRFPCLSYQAWVKPEGTANAAGKIAREIVHPCMAINPAARSIFGAVDFEGLDRAPWVAERHHRFGEASAGLTYTLDRTLRTKLLDLSTQGGLPRLCCRDDKRDYQQEAEQQAI